MCATKQSKSVTVSNHNKHISAFKHKKHRSASKHKKTQKCFQANQKYKCFQAQQTSPFKPTHKQVLPSPEVRCMVGFSFYNYQVPELKQPVVNLYGFIQDQVGKPTKPSTTPSFIFPPDCPSSVDSLNLYISRKLYHILL